MSIIGDIVGSIAKAVLPMPIEMVFPEAAAKTAPHHDAGTTQSTGPTAPITEHLSNFVATNGLHSVAR